MWTGWHVQVIQEVTLHSENFYVVIRIHWPNVKNLEY